MVIVWLVNMQRRFISWCKKLAVLLMFIIAMYACYSFCIKAFGPTQPAPANSRSANLA